MEIRVAVAEHPAGPFVDAGRRLTAEPFAIDAHVFADVDGSRWLFYAADFLARSHVGTGTVRDRLLDPFTLEGNPRPVALPRHDWHVYHPRRPEKGGVRWHTVEGPFVLRRKGVYYEMFSGGNWQNPTYGVSYATARSLRGSRGVEPGGGRRAGAPHPALGGGGGGPRPQLGRARTGQPAALLRLPPLVGRPERPRPGDRPARLGRRAHAGARSHDDGPVRTESAHDLGSPRGARRAPARRGDPVRDGSAVVSRRGRRAGRGAGRAPGRRSGPAPDRGEKSFLLPPPPYRGGRSPRLGLPGRGRTVLAGDDRRERHRPLADRPPERPPNSPALP